MGNIGVSPSGVNTVAQSIQSLADEATGNAGHCADASVTAALANPGWVSSAALTDCAQTWAQHIDGMVTEMGQLAEKLGTSAASYTKADADASTRFQRILTEFAQNTWSAG